VIGKRNSPPTGGTGDPAARNRNQRPGMSNRMWWLFVLGFVIFNLFFYGARMATGTQNKPSVDLSYSQFVAQIRAGNVATANLTTDTAAGTFRHPYKNSPTGKSFSRYSTSLVPQLLSTVVPLLEKNKARVSLQSQAVPAWANVVGLLLQGLPFLLLIALFYFGTRAARQQQQGVFGFGRSRAKLYTEEQPRTTFDDVAGVAAAKSELREIVDFLRDPEKYHRLGARIPKGVLLVGPPGTGKTLLARAVAGEAHVPFFSISSSEFVEMFVGVGASRVRDLFEQAKAASPAIIFVDEIDAIGGRRGGPGAGRVGANDEREQTLNQLLTSMDGFEPNEALIVMAATNRPDVLDPALLRPGRFDRQVTLDPPDRRGREAILKIHTRHIPLDPQVDLAAIAQATPGMTGADLANLCNEAALNAARKGESAVHQADLDEALDRITLGSEGSPLMDAEERRTVAYHEGGHSLVALMLPNVDPVHRVTITPRGRSLGVTQFRPLDDRRNYRRDYLINRLAVGMGGRAAEEVACGEITSGGQNDFQQVTRMARAMVMQLGMSDELGPAYFGGGDDAINGLTYAPWEPKEYSDETADRIDKAVLRLVNEAHDCARNLLTENRAVLDTIAAALMHDESLDAEQLRTIVHGHGERRLTSVPVDAEPLAPIAPRPAAGS
jgi:cell division protease FtsH